MPIRYQNSQLNGGREVSRTRIPLLESLPVKETSFQPLLGFTPHAIRDSLVFPLPFESRQGDKPHRASLSARNVPVLSCNPLS
jgi:hypothetical protein